MLPKKGIIQVGFGLLSASITELVIAGDVHTFSVADAATVAGAFGQFKFQVGEKTVHSFFRFEQFYFGKVPLVFIEVGLRQSRNGKLVHLD